MEEPRENWGWGLGHLQGSLHSAPEQTGGTSGAVFSRPGRPPGQPLSPLPAGTRLFLGSCTAWGGTCPRPGHWAVEAGLPKVLGCRSSPMKIHRLTKNKLLAGDPASSPEAGGDPCLELWQPSYEMTNLKTQKCVQKTGLGPWCHP